MGSVGLDDDCSVYDWFLRTWGKDWADRECDSTANEKSDESLNWWSMEQGEQLQADAPLESCAWAIEARVCNATLMHQMPRELAQMTETSRQNFTRAAADLLEKQLQIAAVAQESAGVGCGRIAAPCSSSRNDPFFPGDLDAETALTDLDQYVRVEEVPCFLWAPPDLQWDMDGNLLVEEYHPDGMIVSDSTRLIQDNTHLQFAVPMEMEGDWDPEDIMTDYLNRQNQDTDIMGRSAAGIEMEDFQGAPLQSTSLSASSVGSNQLTSETSSADNFGRSLELTSELQQLMNASPHAVVTPLAQSGAHTPKKRSGKTTLYTGVSTRYDGHNHVFTAYYKPPSDSNTDFSVFLGEYRTEEDAKDAYNLLALLHEGADTQVDFRPFTKDRYAAELQEWKGKHHADLVCDLRLRGRGKMEDNTTPNYKNVEWRWSIRKQKTRYAGKYKSSKIFDTAQEAAAYADREVVKVKGRDAWTNFAISTYVGDLPLDYLPLSIKSRENRTYKRRRT